MSKFLKINSKHQKERRYRSLYTHYVRILLLGVP